jgi:plastocyanin
MNKRVLGGATAAILLTLAACGSGEKGRDTPAKAVTTNAVEAVKSYRFSPAEITVAAGSTVTWTNNDNFVHNVHLLGGDTTKPLPIGGSASITFNDPGLIRYECSLHPAQMKGSIRVT